MGSRAAARRTASASACSRGSSSDGQAGEIDLTGLAAALVIRYDDDEPGSPWSFVVHVDERGSAEQQTALAAILTGELGGEVLRLPWVSKPSNLLDVRSSPIEIVDSADGHELRVGRAVRLRASTPYRDRRGRRLRDPGLRQARHRADRRRARRRRCPVRVGAHRQLRLREPVRLLVLGKRGRVRAAGDRSRRGASARSQRPRPPHTRSARRH